MEDKLKKKEKYCRKPEGIAKGENIFCVHSKISTQSKWEATRYGRKSEGKREVP